MRIALGFLVILCFNPLSMGSDAAARQGLLQEARERYAEGDYNAARDLCEEMARSAPLDSEVTSLLDKTSTQLRRLASEAYEYGVEAEHMGMVSAARQYWTRAMNYVRSGDALYTKIQAKREQYQ